ELIMRGVLQRWMTGNPRAADATLLAALFCAILLGVSAQSSKGPPPAWGALLFLATVGPGYMLFEWLTRRWLPRPGAARAIYSTSLLFAALHGQVWPTPVPLFFLSLGLGYLAHRTQSLVAPIVAHSLFNALTVLNLIGSQVLPS